MRFMNWHNHDGEAGSCTRCAGVHTQGERLKLNERIERWYWTPIPQKFAPEPYSGDAGDETDAG